MCNTSDATWAWTAEDGDVTHADSVFTTSASVYIQFIIIVTLDVFCVLGNGLLIACVWSNVQLHTLNNALIVNLAVADLQVSLLVLPIWSATTLRQGALLPGGLCTAVAMVTFTFFLESMSTLGVIALDRYISICHPLRYQGLVTPWKVGGAVAYTWVQSISLSALPLLGFGRYAFESSELTICSIDIAGDTHFGIVVLVLTVLPSCSTIMVCYFKIFKVAKMQFQRVNAMALESVGVSVLQRVELARNKVGPSSHSHSHGNSSSHHHSDHGMGIQDGVQGSYSSDPSTFNDGPSAADCDRETKIVPEQKETLDPVQEIGGSSPGSPKCSHTQRSYSQSDEDEVQGKGAESDFHQNPATQVHEMDYQADDRSRPCNSRRISTGSWRRQLNSDFRIEPIPFHAVESSGLWFKTSKVVRNSIRQIRAFRTVFTIIGCFLTCWTPYVALLFHAVVTARTPNYTLEFIVTFLAFLNSIANPVICVTINRDFRKAFVKLARTLCPPWRRQQLIREAVDAFASSAATSDVGYRRTARAGSETSSSVISETTLRELRRMYF